MREIESSDTLTSKSSSLRAQLEHGLKEAIYNLVSWFEISQKETVTD
jgi:hypothetical protein